MIPIFNKTKKIKVYLPRSEEEKEHLKTQAFLDMCAPTAIKFNPDYYICGSSYRSTWAIREYPTETNEQAILRHLGEKSGVVLRIYSRHVTSAEERRIIQNAASKNRMNSQTTDIQQSVAAESNLQDMTHLIAQMHRNREPLLHCAVFIEISAPTLEELKELQTDVMAELTRSKLSVDRLLLRQKEGFQSTQLCGNNAFAEQFERVLPASSTANLFPFNYSGKTDPHGFYLGHDKFGSNLIVDFQRRSADKTNANILILGNSGEGKSYLMKLILTNMRESGMNIVALDAEFEYYDLCKNLGGCYVDMLSGENIINVLEPKLWSDGSSDDETEQQEVTKSSKLSQHISFLRDFFRAYKDFDDSHIDTLEIILQKLYKIFSISDQTDFSKLTSMDYPILSDLYALLEEEQENFQTDKSNLYTAEILQHLRRSLHSMCIGADSNYFNGYSNIGQRKEVRTSLQGESFTRGKSAEQDDKFIVFGVKELLEGNENIKNALLFNILSFMADSLLTKGNTIAAVDELYLFLSNTIAVEYLRNFMKRVRKKESAVIIASQNLEDFTQPKIAELTKPLFAIPTHQFLFYPGNISQKTYTDMLQLDENLFDLIKHSNRGVCVFRHGIEVYNLVIKAQKYKEALFGEAGGR